MNAAHNLVRDLERKSRSIVEVSQESHVVLYSLFGKALHPLPCVKPDILRACIQFMCLSVRLCFLILFQPVQRRMHALTSKR